MHGVGFAFQQLGYRGQPLGDPGARIEQRRGFAKRPELEARELGSQALGVLDRRQVELRALLVTEKFQVFGARNRQAQARVTEPGDGARLARKGVIGIETGAQLPEQRGIGDTLREQ